MSIENMQYKGYGKTFFEVCVKLQISFFLKKKLEWRARQNSHHAWGHT